MSDYVALYRKWRPTVFADVVGQDHITKVLCAEVSSQSVSHAYLFCGSRGTGKTTCAKILAKAVNCQNPQNGNPCGACPSCLAFDNSYDIVEMDAASNNGVDNIRSLCDKVNFMPIEMKKRVYIIDEVHMLSDSAFNALLKTLEEPPSHVMFILATTEINEVLPTIRSRCKRFDFHRISPEQMLPRLRYISDTEKIGINDDALRLIAFLATGALRDALSMLELFVGKTGIDRDAAAQALGVVGNAPVLKLLRDIANKEVSQALLKLDEIYKASKDMGVLCSELAEMFRNLLVVKYASSSVSAILDADPDVISVLRECEDLFGKERLLYSLDIIEQTQVKLAKSGLSRKTLMEIMLVKLCDPKMSTSPQALLERIAHIEAQLMSGSFTCGISEIKEDTAKMKRNVLDYNGTDDIQNTEDIPVYQREGAVPSLKKQVGSGEDKDAAAQLKAQKSDEKANKQSEQPNEKQAEQEDKELERQAKDAPEGHTVVEMVAFGELLEAVKAQNMVLYSVLSDAYAEIVDESILKVYVNPIAHIMLAGDTAKNEMITNVASKLLGMPVRTVFEKASAPKEKKGFALEDF